VPRDTAAAHATRRNAVRRAATRVGWGLGDQAVSSLTNFICAAVAAHLLSPAQLGAFSLAYVTYAVALNCSRGLATDPLMVRLGGADPPAWRTAVRQCTGLALVVGLGTGTIAVLAGLLVSAPTRGALIALGIILPTLLLQDSWRYAFFVAGRGQVALRNDLVWAAVLVLALMALAASEDRTAFWFLLAWGGAAAVAAVFGLRQASLAPRPDKALSWLRQHRDLAPRYMVESMTGSIAMQIRAYGVGIAVGLAGVGHLAVVTTLLGPVMIVMVGIGAVIVPELSKILRRSPRRMEQVCLALSGGLSCATILWALVVWIGLPHGLGDLLVGSVWHAARPLIPVAALGMAIGSLSAGAGGGLHALGAARRSLRAMLIGGILQASLSVAGAFLGGVEGALWGTAAASSMSALVWWRELHCAVRDREALVSQVAGVSEALPVGQVRS
jgi:O-antigen/teichoic acid export membrane protein